MPCMREKIADNGRWHGKADLPFLLAGQGGERDCRNEGKGENKMRYASVCSGVEAASLAWMPLGWEAVWFSEIEPFPCAVLKERFPDVPNIGDMTKIEGEKYRGTVDLLVGGTPCQGFSVAGKQEGIDDPRSALCLSYCRLLETMRPRWFVWENVPGVFSTNGGEDFRAFLRKIDEIGYSCAWRVLDAQFVRVDGFPRAVPQRRRRVFVVGYSGDWRYPASVLFEPGCLPGDTPPRRVKGAGVARSLTASTGGASGKEQQHTFISGDGRPLNAICRAGDMANSETGMEVGTTLLARQYKSTPFVFAHETGQGYWQDGDIAGTLRAEGENRPSRPSNIICAGFSGGQGEKAGGIGYREEVSPTIRGAESGSNQVPDILCQYGDIAGALTARHDSSPCADRGMSIVYENHAQDSRVKPCGECSPQINAKAGTGADGRPLNALGVDGYNGTISGEVSATVDTRCKNTNGPTLIMEHYHANGLVMDAEFWNGEDVSTTLTGALAARHDSSPCADRGMNFVYENHPQDSRVKPCGECSPHLNAKAGTGGGNLPLVQECFPATAVRRLLPVECERLMGFPDNWTRIPWRSKPEDQCPDSPRYKACGNSMCVNVMRWIGMRIENLERRMKGVDHE